MDETHANTLLLDLLIRAAEAHGIHEKDDLGGKYDEQWPQWYAAHMAHELSELGYHIHPN